MRQFANVVLLSLAALCWTAGHPSVERAPRPVPAPGVEPTDRMTLSRPPAAPDAGWLAAAQRTIDAMEYEASVNQRGLQTPNRAHNLRTYFEPEGIRVMDRTAAGEPQLLRIRLSAAGREGALTEVGAAVVRHERSRVELARDDLVEWYVNSPSGLEQGFTIAAPPAGDGPIVLQLRVEGAAVSLAGEEATFHCSSEGGRELQYAKLAAYDANGTALPAHLEATGDGLRIVTDDRSAAYPVTIDPLITSTHDIQLILGQTGSQFGRSVASAGDVNGDGYGDIMIGAEAFDEGQTNEGGVFLYYGGPNGLTTTFPLASWQSNQIQGFLGRGIAAGDFNGDGYSDVVLGAYLYTLGHTAEGAAFVFMGGPSGISSGTPATAAATLQSNVAGSRFGIAAGCGDVNGDGYDDVIIGAPDFQPNESVFIFHGSAAGIPNGSPATAATTLQSTTAGSEFGWVVAGAGDLNGDGFSDVAVGCPRYTSGQNFEGGVFVFQGGSAGVANATVNTASGSVQSDIPDLQFGFSLCGAGDVNGDGYADLAAGTQNYSNGQTGEGGVWVFHGSSGGIGNLAITNANSRIESNRAGAGMAATASLGCAGDVNGDGYSDLIVGAERYALGHSDEGAAFVFLGSAAGITATQPSQAYATLQSDQIGARLGLGVAGAGDVNGDGFDDVLAGALLWDGTTADQGAAFLALGGAKGMVNGDFLSARALIESNQSLAAGMMYPELGASVAFAGDMNGDGIGDIILGSPGYDLGEADEGAAFIFQGGPFASGAPASAFTTLQGNVTGSRFGQSVAGAGDVNGDGHGDVIVGAPEMAPGGAAYVFTGSPAGVANGDPTTAAATLSSDQSGAQMGVSVASAGDVNGDGFADVIVGAESYDSNHGGAFIFHGSATGVASATAAAASGRLTSPLGIGKFGHSVAGAGDVNGDGFADVIVGAPNMNLGQSLEGAAYVFHGSSIGLGNDIPEDADAILESNEVDARLGTSVASAGDVNGDGFSDVIAGAINYGATNTGAAFVWRGAAAGVFDGPPNLAYMTLMGTLANGKMGASVACAGDLDADGLADLIVGQPDSVNFLGQGNRAFIYMGSRVGLPPPVASPVRATLSGLQGGMFGASVAGVGDQDGDGFADVIVGAPWFDWSESNEGIACLFNGGNAALGRPQRVTQHTGSPVLVNVPPGGVSNSPDAFRVFASMVNPAGRQRLKLEVEDCPPGAAFGSASCTRTTTAEWQDTAPLFGLTTTHLVSPVPGGLNRWRARTLMAPFAVTESGITPPSNPRHGPWRRPHAQVAEADIRVMALTVAVEIRHDEKAFAIERLVNPTRDHIEFSVVLPGRETAKAELFDVAGRRWISRDLQASGPSRVEFRSRERLPSGAYILRVTQGPRSAQASVVVIQ